MSLTALIPLLGNVLDKLFPDANAAKEAKLRLLELEQEGQLKHLEAQVSIISAEAKGESWLQRNWRPILMLTFTSLIVARWLGFADHSIGPELELKLLDIVELGIGGYVIGRSGEKIVKGFPNVLSMLKQ